MRYVRLGIAGSGAIAGEATAGELDRAPSARLFPDFGAASVAGSTLGVERYDSLRLSVFERLKIRYLQALHAVTLPVHHDHRHYDLAHIGPDHGIPSAQEARQH